MSGFTEVRTESLDLLQATAHEFVHTTGAKWIHFECADENNQFAAIMPTVPTNEKGEPHILEHCLFAGSKRYPDSRSQGTLVTTGGGAWTGWEYTWYFFSGPSHPDFLKRADIWCDALFEPLLEHETFLHQAHHLEFEDPDDPSTPLRYRGVIYNEQKGIMGLPIYMSWMGVCRSLFPGHPYALEHGGTPRDVVTITYEQLKDFHQRHYHPANAHLLTWGDIDMRSVRDMLDEALTRVPERPFTRPQFPPVTPLTAPVRGKGMLPIGANEDPTGRAMISMGWVTADCTDPYESLMHDLIVEILLGSSTSPLRSAIAESGLGTYSSGFDSYGIRYVKHTVSAGIEGTNPDVADDYEALVMKTLEQLATEGIDPRAIDVALNRLEFQRRTLASAEGDEGTATGFFIRHLNTAWLAGGDPLAGAKMPDLLERFEKDRANGRPLEDRLRAWFIDNPHRTLVVIEPVSGVDVQLEAEETATLAEIKERMSEDERKEVVAQTQKIRDFLAARSTPPEAPTTPPDIRKPRLDTLTSEAAGVPVVAYPTRTNGITYVDLFCDLGGLPDDLWDLLKIFTTAITKAGSDGRTPADTESLIGTITGGINAEVNVPLCGVGDDHLRLLHIGGRAVERHQDDLVGLITSLVRSATFTPDVLRAVVDAALAHAEQYVYIDAPGYLRRLAGSNIRTSWGLRDRLDGFGQLAVLRQLARADDAGLEKLAAQLEEIRAYVARRGALEVFVAAAGNDAIDRLVPALDRELSTIDAGGEATGPLPDRRAEPLTHHARTFGQPTAFNAAVWAPPTFAHADGPALLIAGSLAGRWVRTEVARKGTAYSAAADGYSAPGSLVCWSTRDPNVARTFKAFDDSVRKLQDGPIEQEEFALGQLEASIAWDMPAPPAQRARREYIRDRAGFGADAQERFRELAKNVTADDVKRAAAEHLSAPAARATLTSAEMVERAATEGYSFDMITEA